MAYFPDPEDVTLPLDTDYVGEATPPELRALKGRITSEVSNLLNQMGDGDTQVAQEAANALAELSSTLGDAINSVTQAFDTFKARTNNPHNVTKSQVGLSEVNNWGATSAINDNSADKYSTAAAAYALAQAIQTINNWKANKDISDASLANRLALLEADWNTVSAAAQSAAQSAQTCASKASDAAASAIAAQNSAASSASSAANANTSATNAANSASSASTRATQAANSASSASTSASSANTRATNAASSASTAASSASSAVVQAEAAKALVGKSYRAYSGYPSGRSHNFSLSSVATNLGITVDELKTKVLKITSGGFWSKRGVYASLNISMDMKLAEVKHGTHDYWRFMADSENAASGTAFAKLTSSTNIQIWIPSWMVTNGSWHCVITIGL